MFKLLSISWDKVLNSLHFHFPSPPAEMTKREILTNLAKVYDLLILASPILLEGKLLYQKREYRRVRGIVHYQKTSQYSGERENRTFGMPLQYNAVFLFMKKFKRYNYTHLAMPAVKEFEL